MQLSEFIIRFNSSDLPAITDERYAHDYGAEVGMSAARQLFGTDEFKSGLRVSSLGYYAITQGLKLYVLALREPRKQGIMAARFHTGDVVESMLLTMMKAYGVSVSHQQETITWEGVPGHIDCIVEGGVVDVKTASTNSAYKMVKELPLTYLTQISVYRQAMNAEWAGCLIYDKNSHVLSLVKPPQASQDKALERARKVVEVLSACKSYHDVVRECDIPEAKPEVYRKANTGKLVPPDGMWGKDMIEALYKTYESNNGYNKPTTYIARARTEDELIRYIDKLC